MGRVNSRSTARKIHQIIIASLYYYYIITIVNNSRSKFLRLWDALWLSVPLEVERFRYLYRLTTRLTLTLSQLEATSWAKTASIRRSVVCYCQQLCMSLKIIRKHQLARVTRQRPQPPVIPRRRARKRAELQNSLTGWYLNIIFYWLSAIDLSYQQGNLCFKFYVLLCFYSWVIVVQMLNCTGGWVRVLWATNPRYALNFCLLRDISPRCMALYCRNIQNKVRLNMNYIIIIIIIYYN